MTDAPEIKDEGDFSWCLTCHGVTRGRCRCMMHQQGIDTSDCPAHRRIGHTGSCSCNQIKVDRDLYPVHVVVDGRDLFLTEEEMARMWDTHDGYDALTRWGYDPSRIVELGLVKIEHRERGDSPAWLTDLGRAAVEARRTQVERVLGRLHERGYRGSTCQRVHTAGRVALSVETLERLLG